MDTAALIRRGAEARLAEIQVEMKELEVLIGSNGDGGLPTESRRLHWTQRPENRARVEAMHKKAAKTRRKKAR